MASSPSGRLDSVSNGSLLQNSIYVAINIENILYGMELLLYFKTLRILLGKRRMHKKSDSFYTLFSSMMVFLITVWVATAAIFGQKMWLIDSNYPGGADAYWKNNISVWYMDWGTTAVILLQLMTDGLMIYRCRIIWNSYHAIIIPTFLWLCTVVLGVLVDWTSSIPGGDFFTGLAAQLALAYYSVSVFLNTMLTCMICYRIVRHGKFVRDNLGRQYASVYFGVVALVVESVLPYTLSGIAFLVSLGAGSATSVTFLSVYVVMMCISPQMLILRVIGGRAWDDDTYAQPISALNFSPTCTPESQRVDSRESGVDLQRLSKGHLSEGESKVAISLV